MQTGRFFLTWRPARAEWLCCFLGPSVADVFPPELLPPEDLPFPPAIVIMFFFVDRLEQADKFGEVWNLGSDMALLCFAEGAGVLLSLMVV